MVGSAASHPRGSGTWRSRLSFSRKLSRKRKRLSASMQSGAHGQLRHSAARWTPQLTLLDAVRIRGRHLSMGRAVIYCLDTHSASSIVLELTALAHGSRRPGYWRLRVKNPAEWSTVSFLIADIFADGLARLTGDEQKAVKTTAFDLQMNPASARSTFRERCSAGF